MFRLGRTHAVRETSLPVPSLVIWDRDFSKESDLDAGLTSLVTTFGYCTGVQSYCSVHTYGLVSFY